MKPKDKTALSARILSTAADIRTDKQRRIVLAATAALAINICYAVYNGVLGIIYSSPWLAVLCAYYLILSVMRFFGGVLRTKVQIRRADVYNAVLRRNADDFKPCVVIFGILQHIP